MRLFVTQPSKRGKKSTDSAPSARFSRCPLISLRLIQSRLSLLQSTGTRYHCAYSTIPPAGCRLTLPCVPIESRHSYQITPRDVRLEAVSSVTCPGFSSSSTHWTRGLIDTPIRHRSTRPPSTLMHSRTVHQCSGHNDDGVAGRLS